MASNFLTEALDEALKMFGLYTYEDKGVEEVMYAEEHIRTLQNMGADEVIEATNILLEHEHGAEFYEYIYSRLVEDMDHPEPDELYERMYYQLPGDTPIIVERKNFGDLLR